MIHWRQTRSRMGRPIMEGLLGGERAFLLWPAKRDTYELHVALPPGAPVKTFRGMETGKRAARQFLKHKLRKTT